VIVDFNGVNKEAARLLCDYLELFTLETLFRSVKMAELQGSESVELRHLQIILPQLLVDF
jgi:hypothetical protein